MPTSGTAESNRQDVSSENDESAANGDSLWRLVIASVVIAAIVLSTIFRDTTWSMITTWRNSSYSHGYAILPLSLYLIYAVRRRFDSVEVRPNPWALVLLAGLGFAWFVADLAAVQFVKQGALVGMVPTLVWLMSGTRVVRVILFPLLFLFFAVPMGEVLVPWLQDFSAAFAVKLLDLVGIPVLLERRLILVPSGAWEVAEACSGLRFLTASVVVGCFYAYVVYRSWTRRIAFVVASVAVPILANGMRVFGIIVLGYLSNNRLAAGVDHLVYGWIFFGLVIFVLFAAGWHWRELRTGGLAELHPPSALPDHSSVRRGLLWGAAGVALVVVAPLSARLVNADSGDVAVAISAPSVLPPWTPSRSDIGAWRPRSVEVTSELKQTYTSGDRPVYLYLAYYAGGQGGRKLVSSSNAISGSRGWWDGGTRTRTAVVDGDSISVYETVLRSQEGSLLVWSWYWVDGKFTDNPYHAKFLRVRARLFGGPQASAFLAVGANCASDRTDAGSALQDFLHHTSLRGALDGTSK
jgi:exosortase A